MVKRFGFQQSARQKGWLVMYRGVLKVQDSASIERAPRDSQAHMLALHETPLRITIRWRDERSSQHAWPRWAISMQGLSSKLQSHLYCRLCLQLQALFHQKNAVANRIIIIMAVNINICAILGPSRTVSTERWMPSPNRPCKFDIWYSLMYVTSHSRTLGSAYPLYSSKVDSRFQPVTCRNTATAHPVRC